MRLTFDERFSGKRLLLVELPPPVLSDIENGRKLCLKGDEKDDLTLCTDAKTYAVKRVDTSNVLLLVDAPLSPDGPQSLTVQGKVPSFLELGECPPKLGRLEELLGEHPYEGEATNVAMSGYTSTQLSERVQASRAELELGLRLLHAIDLNGTWQVLAPGYAARVFGVILTSAVAEAWDLNRLNLKDVAQSVEEHDAPLFVVRSLLCKYGKPVDVPSPEDSRAAKRLRTDGGNEIFALDRRLVCQFRAVQLLQMQNVWPYEAFHTTWNESDPEALIPEPDDLKGIALIADSGTEHGDKQVEYFPATALPIDAKKRVGALFDQRKSWTLEEITPYLEGIAIGGENMIVASNI